MSIDIVDPHLHFFNLQKGQYHWLKPNNAPNWLDKSKIHRSFDFNDLVLEQPFNLKGLVHIEAGFNNQFPEQEIASIENDLYSYSNKLSLACIAFIDITLEPDIFKQQLNILQSYKSLRGFRHIFDELTLEILSSPNVLINLRLIEEKGFVFELQFSLLNERHTAAIMSVFSNFDRLKLVLNHAGFAHLSDAKNTNVKAVKAQIKIVSQLKNLHIKLSGFEMTSREYTFDSVCLTIDAFAEHFEQDVMMIASNFPVLLLASTYHQYWSDALRASQHCGLKFKNLAYKNAKSFYLLD